MVALFILAVFLLIILTDLVVLKMQGKYHPAFEPESPQYPIPILDGSSYAIPSNVYLSKGHTWFKKNEDGLIDIGIDAFGATALGKFSVLKCAEEGKELKRGEVIFEGGYGNNIIKFIAPISGIVKSVNQNIIGKEIASPYETWGVQLLPKENNNDNGQSISGIKASNWLAEEFVRLKNFIERDTLSIAAAGETMYDGGLMTSNSIPALVDKAVNDFEKEFLSL